MQPLTPGALAQAAATFALGLLVGAVGTVMHRSVPPWGLVLCIALVAGAGVLSRAWAGGAALATLAGGVFLSIVTLARRGPGGDVLVPDGQGIGWAWVAGAVVALVAATLAPRAMFSDEPRAPRRATVGRPGSETVDRAPDGASATAPDGASATAPDGASATAPDGASATAPDGAAAAPDVTLDGRGESRDDAGSAP